MTTLITNASAALRNRDSAPGGKHPGNTRAVINEQVLWNKALKKYHTLCGKLRLDDETRRGMLWRSYGVTSSAEMKYSQLLDAVAVLERELNPEQEEMDKWRKRLIKSIDTWLTLTGKEKNISIVKAIACRAAKRTNFNEIPKEQLRSLYAAFTGAQKDQRAVNELIEECL
jgi:hypothetical protein